jgi:hypothetical protein
MLALRYLYVLALVLWLGGMAVLGILVAPTIFEVLQAGDPSLGRELAGAVFGTTIARFHYVAYGCGLTLLLSIVAMALLGPRPAGFGIRAAIIVLMLGVALYSGLWVLRDMNQVQASAGMLPSKLPATDARRARFDQLHLLSTRLMGFNMVGALVLLYWEAREHE